MSFFPLSVTNPRRYEPWPTKRVINELRLTSFPFDFKDSTSSGVNVAMEMDFTRCGGVKPRLEKQIKHDFD